MTRPALEARHLATLQEMFAVCGNERRMQEADALDAAIRALSADRGEAVLWKVTRADGTFYTTDGPMESNVVAAFLALGGKVTPLYEHPPSTAAPSGVSDVRILARDIHYAITDDGLAPLSPTDNNAMREAILRVLQGQPQPGRVEGCRQDAVDREVRICRRFYGKHNPPNTMLATLFNDILIANGTFESDHEANARREEASKAPAASGQEPAP